MALYKMTQVELKDAVAEKTGLSRADVQKVLAALTEVVQDNLGACIRTEVAGVTVEPKLRAATKKRLGRNPATGEELMIGAKPASVRVAARVGVKVKQYAPGVQKLKNSL